MATYRKPAAWLHRDRAQRQRKSPAGANAPAGHYSEVWMAASWAYWLPAQLKMSSSNFSACCGEGRARASLDHSRAAAL
jgi:hypothetical protein